MTTDAPHHLPQFTVATFRDVVTLLRMASTTDRDSFALTDPYHLLRVRAIFSQKAQDDTEGRYTICLAVRDKLLRNATTQPRCFQAFHSLMYEESIEDRNLIQHVTSGQVYDDNQLEYETWCHWNAKIAAFLEFGSPPNKDDAVKVCYCGSDDAANLIESGALLVIESQQPFPWNGPPLIDCFKRLPDPECLRRLEPRDLTRNSPSKTPSFKATMKVKHWVSIPTRQRDTVNAKGQVTRRLPFFERTLQQIQNKLINETPKDDDNLPCRRLGSRYLFYVSSGPYRDWLDLAQLAGPAKVGTGPISGQARYLVLRPGQTVYMPPGTIHYVFRKLSDPTLITGGEVLTWTGLRRWLCLLKQQELSETEPAVTVKKAGGWVACLIKLVKQRREAQDWDDNPGGQEELEFVMNTLEVGSAVTLAAKLLTWADQK
ncbi:hypothetical protein FDENT_10938 [Fusarium denticulatum]|uniref:JmjC domain-containing protein n=1 Tax=Fusarium denticulatum TaxID=48507 RepID=A0A8H5TLR0_9HYPO|nr:hypothetical protein FDENT_10938 [Fusarium denticulatum]